MNGIHLSRSRLRLSKPLHGKKEDLFAMKEKQKDRIKASCIEQWM
jgi:hypothetical protein